MKNQTSEASMRPLVNCPGPVGITRRNMLQIGVIGTLNLALPQVLAASARPARNRGEPVDVSLAYREGVTIFLTFALGYYAGSPRFDRDGRVFAWGNLDGTVLVCDLERVNARLSQAGLGW